MPTSFLPRSLASDLEKFIADFDDFKGGWEALKTLWPERLNALRSDMRLTIAELASLTQRGDLITISLLDPAR